MTILLLNQFFWPDAAATSQLLTDVARGLASRGHNVHVIAADRSYAIEDETDNRPAVQIHRVKSVRFMRGLLGRVSSYASFFVGCAWKGLRVPRPDVVLTLTTPPLLSIIGNLLHWLRGSKHFIWEMDMYPDVAVDLNYIAAGGLADRIIGTIADFSRSRSQGILALGECMRERLIRRGIPAGRIAVADNWADSRVIRPASWPQADAPFTVLYSGNLGLAHEVETISGAISGLRNDGRFRFVFVGAGARRAALEAFCSDQGITNVDFQSYKPKAALGQSLGEGHIGLITQQESCLGSVVPSKVYGLLAAGRPILFIGPKESTVARIIRQFQCGWHVDCKDVSALLALLERLEGHRSQVKAAGARARKALLKQYDLPLGVSRICTLIGASSKDEAPNLFTSDSTEAFSDEGTRLASIT